MKIFAAVIWLSILAFVVYFIYIYINRNNPVKEALATALLIASPIPPIP